LEASFENSKLPHLVPKVTKLKFTVCVGRAKVVLDECCKVVSDLVVKLPTLCISGVDHFQNAVVFAKVQSDEEFDQLRVIASML